MAFDWQNFHIPSEKLLTESDAQLQESAYRSAISRSYYAVRHIAREKFPDAKRFNAKTMASIQEKRNLGDLLGQLRDERNAADYTKIV